MSADGFEEFVTIVDAGSLTRAARELRLPRPTVSKRLARLEERLGVRLLHRTTRRLNLTRQGTVLYPKAKRIVQATREAEAAVRRLDDVPRGLLRVSIPTAVPQAVFARWLVDFLTDSPQVSLEVVGSDGHVDLVAEGFDLAMRRGDIEDRSLVTTTLVTNTMMAVASPAYLEAHGAPASVDALGQHNCIIGYTARGTPDLRWPLHDGGWVEVAGNLATNQMGLRLEAARHQLGIALVIDRVAAEHLASGDLVAVLPGVVGCSDRVRLVYPEREFLDPKVRAFADLLKSRVGAGGPGGRPPSG